MMSLSATILILCIGSTFAICPTLTDTTLVSKGPAPGSVCPPGLGTCYNDGSGTDLGDACYVAGSTPVTCVDKMPTQCATWVPNGFCTQAGYTDADRKNYCAKSCNLCTTVGTTCTDSSTNCASWAKNGFCDNTSYDSATKIKYCKSTCNLCS
ncbi:unnamed protein product, partial [Mesorhabditis belari]|uniref:ShKT domain-containing protein n=1 Tax=Mesorhabditis belari TaxID=2138241 RepID=A0AAF3J317_9BILA